MAHNPVLSPERERQLVVLIQRGDHGALGELLGAYHKRVYHVCLRMVRSRDDAAELAQETLLRAVQHADGFRGASRFSTWLLRIAMNLCISHLRKSRLRNAVSLEYDGNGVDQATALKSMIASEREPLPERCVETQEQVQQMIAAVEALEPNLKTVIILRDLQEMDYQEIAEVLSVPVGTVKSRLFRARLALRAAMDGRVGAPTEVADG